MDFELDLSMANQTRALVDLSSAPNATSSTIAVVVRSCVADIMPANFDLNRIYFISFYILLLTVGVVENVGALYQLFQHRFRNRGAKLILINLMAANLIVAVIIIPIEIVWRITYVWPTGLIGCKILQFFRALGHYSTSMMLVVISVDRYLILTKPFCHQSTNTVVIMLICAWLAAIILSSPQVSRYI